MAFHKRHNQVFGFHYSVSCGGRFFLQTDLTTPINDIIFSGIDSAWEPGKMAQPLNYPFCFKALYQIGRILHTLVDVHILKSSYSPSESEVGNAFKIFKYCG